MPRKCCFGFDFVNVKVYHRDPQKAPVVAKIRRLSHYALKASQNVTCSLTKNGIDRKMRFMHAQIHNGQIDYHQILHIHFWANIVIYLDRRPNWLWGFGRVGVPNLCFLHRL